MNKDNIILKTKCLLENYKSSVIAGYLFGSCHTGSMTPLSDIDIAILFDEKLCSEEIENMENEIYAKLIEALGTDEVDLIVLNRAPLSVRFGVLKDKEIIYFSDKGKVVDFQCDVVSEYLDFKPIRDGINKEFLSMMKGKGQKING
jgi:uncharacterized protein